EKLKEFPSLRLHHLKLKKGMSVEEAVKLYQADPDVEYAEPNFLYSIEGQPNDPRFGELWGLRNTGQTGGTAGADIKATAAWDITTGSSDVVVAIIDTGIDYTHPDLAPNIWVNAGIDAVNQDADPFDDHGHGTHVAGTIGAVGNNGSGVAGINWNVKLTACKFLNASGSGSTDAAIQCLQYIKSLKDAGANIVATNNSWGGGAYSQALYDAINAQRNILFIASAGNSRIDADTVPQYPASYNLPNIISVAATDNNDKKAAFSNYGRRSVHVSAPGVKILSTLPAVNEWNLVGGYGLLSGTSMAAPHVTGLAALIKAQDANRDWISIKNLLLAGGDNVSGVYERTITGRRINALGSLSCANKKVFSVLQYPATITVGTPATVSAMSINCESIAGPVTVTLSGGEVITLHDDGVAPDFAAGDGVFTATWTPARLMERLVFASAAGTETIEYPPVGITTKSLPSGALNTPYRQSILAGAGYFPYTFSIISGTLPPGITLNVSSGELSGAPTAQGQYYFTLQVVDKYGARALKDLLFNVNPPDTYEAWHTTGSPYKSDIVVDREGNFYVSFNDGLYKYDGSGNEIWRRDISNGGLLFIPFDKPVAVDKDDYVYFGGLSCPSIGGVCSQYLLAKYDPAGDMVWTKQGHADDVRDIAADSLGNVYLTGGSFGYNTIKFDSAGNELWARNVQISNEYIWDPYMTVDGNANVYLAGYTESMADPNMDVVLAKYDLMGNLSWAKTYDLGGKEEPRDVATDSNGNVYVTGWSVDSPATLFLLKFDPDGDLLWNKPYAQGFEAKGYGVAIDKEDKIYVTGSIQGTPYSATDLLTVIYDTSGNVLSAMSFDGGGAEQGERLALGPSGDLFVVGAGFLTFKYDLKPPTTTPSSAGGTYETTQAVSLRTNEPATIYFTLDGSTPATNSPVYSGPLAISATTTLRYFAVDSVGHGEAVKSASYIILPHATVSGAPSGLTGSSDATLIVGGTDVVAYQYRLDGDSYSAEMPLATPISLSGLGEGLHTISVLGKDNAGNWQVTPTAVSWNVDFTPPIATVSVPPKSASNATFSVGGNDVVAYRYRLDAGSYSSETPVAIKIVLTSLTEGPHSMEVIGRDSAGNWQIAPTSKSWIVDNLPISIPGGETFATILEAYSALIEDNILQLKATGIVENLIFNRNMIVTLRGGYDQASGTATGSTTLYGSLEISSGTVVVDNLVIATLN
ncbi:MAG TPA: S8 family serine peptidase, partial [Geobacteraceae bacterium]|nr:S8 family serine peptidase [Geobacteraceae bacterium]